MRGDVTRDNRRGRREGGPSGLGRSTHPANARSDTYSKERKQGDGVRTCMNEFIKVDEGEGGGEGKTTMARPTGDAQLI